MNDEERQLWRIDDLQCVMISCCTGAELQLRRGGDIVLRELYPMKIRSLRSGADLRLSTSPIEQTQTGSRKIGAAAASSVRFSSVSEPPCASAI